LNPAESSPVGAVLAVGDPTVDIVEDALVIHPTALVEAAVLKTTFHLIETALSVPQAKVPALSLALCALAKVSSLTLIPLLILCHRRSDGLPHVILGGEDPPVQRHVLIAKQPFTEIFARFLLLLGLSL
jgi:hypothetical protein